MHCLLTMIHLHFGPDFTRHGWSSWPSLGLLPASPSGFRQFITGRFAVVAHQQHAASEDGRIPGATVEGLETRDLVVRFGRGLYQRYLAGFELHQEPTIG